MLGQRPHIAGAVVANGGFVGVVVANGGLARVVVVSDGLAGVLAGTAASRVL